MASGDKLHHRGRLTREIVQGLAMIIGHRPLVAVHEVVVEFVGDRGLLARLRLLAALQSVTFDIGACEIDDKRWNWASASHARVRWSNEYDIKQLEVQ